MISKFAETPRDSTITILPLLQLLPPLPTHTHMDHEEAKS
uniref:Uncharacterized protein n=1 Tax=Rhizophora mucronata TaxID=61149 RepID=A0A2P2P1C3_RHIMU